MRATKEPCATDAAEGSDIDARERLAKEPGMRMRRARRSPPRSPAGTWPKREEVLKGGKHFAYVGSEGCIPVNEVPLLSEIERGGIELLELELFRPLVAGINAGAVREEDRRALHAVCELRFGCALETALWLVPYMIELQYGRGERLELERGSLDPSTVDVSALARSVLMRTRLALARAVTFRPMLPSYVSVPLTALFLKRFAYGRGGGPLRSLSEDAIRKLLSEPKALAGYLRAQPSVAKRFLPELTDLDLLITSSE